MSEHFGFKDIWIVLKKNKYLILVFISMLFIIFGFMSLKNILSTFKTGNSDGETIYAASVHYVLQPHIESIEGEKLDQDFYRSIPDDFVAILNSDECANYIYNNLSSIYSKDYIIKNTELMLPNEEIKSLNLEAFKSIYKAQREKNTMIINLYGFSYKSELAKTILLICKNYVNEVARKKIKYADLEESMEVIKEVKSTSSLTLNDDSTNSLSTTMNVNHSLSSKFKSVIKIMAKNLFLPSFGLTLLLVLLLIGISFINPTMNRKSDFCEYDVPILGEVIE